MNDNITTNLEAIACGTPVITFKTGGSVEAINKYTGLVIENNDVENLVESIYSVFDEGIEKYKNEHLEEAKKYDKNLKFEEYIKLYTC